MGRLANPTKAPVLMRAILYHLFSYDGSNMPSWALLTRKWWMEVDKGIDPQGWLWAEAVPAAELKMRTMIQKSIEVASYIGGIYTYV